MNKYINKITLIDWIFAFISIDIAPSIPGSNIAPSDVVRSITLIRVWETVILEDTSLAAWMSPRNSVNLDEKALGSDLYQSKDIGKGKEEMIFSTNWYIDLDRYIDI